MNENTKDNLTWLLILFSPITLGFLIPLLAELNINYWFKINPRYFGVLFFLLCLIYYVIWANFFKKITGRSWLD